MTTPLPIRLIHVVSVAPLTPRLVRVTFGGDDLAGFALAGPDQQVKVLFPRAGQGAPVLPAPAGDVGRWYASYLDIPAEDRPWMRSFTLRGHDPARDTVDIDFVLHGPNGPAARWALGAAPGQVLGMFGPSADFARPVPLLDSVAAADWFLMAGDETALPAIGTLLDWLPAGTPALAFVAAEEIPLPTAADAVVRFVAGGPDGLVAAVRAAALPTDRAFAWLAGEAGAVRALRRHLVEGRGFDKRSIDFAGYWRRRLSQDDAPTTDDLADAREMLALAGGA